MAINTKIKQELQRNLDSLFKYRETRRTQEEIINDILSILYNIRKETFLPFVLQMKNFILFHG